MYVDFFESVIFSNPVSKKLEQRSVLVVCDSGESRQFPAAGIHDVLDYIFESLLGRCDVRRSVNPRDGDINVVPYIEAVGIDIDVPGDLDTAKYEAATIARYVRSLKGKPFVVFTGGKGYSVLIPVYREEADNELYRSVVSDIVNATYVRHVDMNAANLKYLVRVPLTRHRATKNVVAVYDYERDVHVEDAEAILELYDSLEPISIAAVEKKQKISVVKRAATKKVRIRWIEEVEEKCIQDCRKRFILAVLARYLVNVLRHDVDAAVERIMQFASRCGVKIYASWARSVVRAVKEKNLKPYSCEEFFSEKKYYSCNEVKHQC